MRFLGLVIKTAKTEAAHDQMLEVALHRAICEGVRAERAAADMREAQRILAILSQPLMEWDLDDFPGWAENPDKGRGLMEGYPLRGSHGPHLWAVVQAYRVVRKDAARARSAVTVNDSLRGRGWADQPLTSVRSRTPRVSNPDRTLP